MGVCDPTCSKRSNTSQLAEGTKKTSKNSKIAFGFPVFSITWDKIKYMVYASYILNVIAIILSICLLYIAYKVAANISQYLIMITDYDGYTIPSCLLIAGFLSLLTNLLLIYITKRACHRCKNEQVNNMFFIFILICLAISLIVMGLGVFMDFERNTLDCRVHNGILEGMQLYKNDFHMKRKIDTLQLSFQCCGSNSFNDWFKIKWRDAPIDSCTDYAEMDDTPFSCCSLHSALPCIHHNILSVGTAYLYAPETNLSISEYGCMPVLTCYIKSFIWRITICFFILGSLLLIIACLSRFIQTAHMEHGRFQRSCQKHTSWFFGLYRGRKKKRCKKPPAPPPLPCDICSS